MPYDDPCDNHDGAFDPPVYQELAPAGEYPLIAALILRGHGGFERELRRYIADQFTNLSKDIACAWQGATKARRETAEDIARYIRDEADRVADR